MRPVEAAKWAGGWVRWRMEWVRWYLAWVRGWLRWVRPLEHFPLFSVNCMGSYGEIREIRVETAERKGATPGDLNAGFARLVVAGQSVAGQGVAGQSGAGQSGGRKRGRY